MRWDASAACLGMVLALGATLGCGTVSIKRVGRVTAGPVALPFHSSFSSDPPPLPTPAGELPPTVAAIPPVGSEGDPGDPRALLIAAETDRQRGIASVRTSSAIAARFELLAVRQALEALAASEAGPPDRVNADQIQTARAEVAAATRDFLRDSSRGRIHLDARWEHELAAQGVHVRVDTEVSTWTPDRFDEFLIPTDYQIGGLQHEYHSDGVGVPLIGVRRFRPGELTHREGEDKFLLPRQVYPVTAVLQPRQRVPRLRTGGGAGDGVELASLHPPEARVAAAIPPVPRDEYTLELHDPILERRVEFLGRSEPLASDLTTSLTYRFAHSALPILQEIGLLDPQWLEKLAGLYMVHPYIPGRIPIVLVHGLRSSPAAWLQVMNEIRGDPELRDRYQVWLFMYPTGTPFPYSAAKLRAQLNELREVVDPAHADHALDDAVLVGHSMGGLITRLMISSSGDDLWRLISTRPFDDLRATPERKTLLHDIFFFEPHPMITRAVFIATPHRGSELGDQFIGRLADRLIRLPSSLRQTYRALLVQNGRDFFTPEVRSGLPSSIDELRRDNRLLMAMDRLPTRPGLEAHSIIGRKTPTDAIERSTDGVVPYASSHIDWAVSEKVVAGDHGCQREPATIDELRTILARHLRQNSSAPVDAEVHRIGSGRGRGQVDAAIRRASGGADPPAPDAASDTPPEAPPRRSRPIARSVGEPEPDETPQAPEPAPARATATTPPTPRGWRPVRP